MTLLLPLLGACPGAQQRPDELKVSRAVLYQNGIGYFERHGRVEGNVLRLRILPQQIADVLKSLTVVDLGTGRAINVALPVEKTQARRLASLPHQVRESGGLIGIAQAFRGARAKVSSGDGSGEGRIVGVEQLSPATDKRRAEWRLTILRDDGTLQTFNLAKVHDLEVKDRTLEVGLRKALDVSLDEGSWKPVELTVHLAGPTPHEVLVSYVVEMPTWKPAYRVVMSKDARQGLLQGWAVVDNVSGEDWDQVKLALTAGTPLTFTYDLYSPRFVQRPDLSPAQEAMAVAPPPPTDGAAAAEPEAQPALAPPPAPKTEGKQAEEERAERRDKKVQLRRPSRSRAAGPVGGIAGKSGEEADEVLAEPAPAPEMNQQLLEKSFRALVAGSRVGSLFRYDIAEPVTIKDRQSALVSILNAKLPAENVLLYRIDYSSTNPYRAVRLTNNTGFMIEKGPVAIYDDGNFVGEAVGGQVENKTSAFIPYSVDGRIIVSLQDEVKDEAAHLVKIVDGQIVVETKQVALHKYSIHNASGEAATLYVQRAHRPGWKLTKPDQGVLIEKDNYFAPVKLAASGKTDLEVREETPVRRWVTIYSAEGRQAIALYLKDPSSDPKVRASLREALELQEKLSKLEEEMARLRREKDTYASRQSEVRDNIKLLGKSIRNADMARKLSATLLDLETKLNEATRGIVAKDIKRSEMRDRLTVLFKSVTLEVK